MVDQLQVRRHVLRRGNGGQRVERWLICNYWTRSGKSTPKIVVLHWHCLGVHIIVGSLYEAPSGRIQWGYVQYALRSSIQTPSAELCLLRFYGASCVSSFWRHDDTDKKRWQAVENCNSYNESPCSLWNSSSRCFCLSCCDSNKLRWCKVWIWDLCERGDLSGDVSANGNRVVGMWMPTLGNGSENAFGGHTVNSSRPDQQALFPLHFSGKHRTASHCSKYQKWGKFEALIDVRFYQSLNPQCPCSISDRVGLFLRRSDRREERQLNGLEQKRMPILLGN
jgi:hypothetical protein